MHGKVLPACKYAIMHAVLKNRCCVHLLVAVSPIRLSAAHPPPPPLTRPPSVHRPRRLFFSSATQSLRLRPSSSTMTNFSDFSGVSHIKPQINLLRGWPHPSLLPVASLQKAASNVLASPDVFVPGLQYGADAGHEPLRSAIASWLTSFYQPVQPTTSERLAITGGASQNLGCVLQAYSDPVYTRRIWCVAPAYMLAFRTFEDAGFAGKMRSVPEDHDGCDVRFLEREIAKVEEMAIREGNLEPVGLVAAPSLFLFLLST